MDRQNGSKDDNVIITVLNETNTAEEACRMLSSNNGSAAELADLARTETITGFKQGAVAGIEVLVMPP